MNKVNIQALTAWLNQTLEPNRFKDYCPNGLQVAGVTSIGHIITGVTASEALLRQAIARRADALLVHHGWFWKNENPCLFGPRRTRLALTLAHNLNLFAYHLPLDAHTTFGNNAQLAQVLGLQAEIEEDATPLRHHNLGNLADAAPPRRCGPDNLIWLGQVPGINRFGQLIERVAQRLQRPPQWIGHPDKPIHRIAWCTGAAQSLFSNAIDAGVDVYLTGEISEPTVHLARETGVGFIAAGHHATERYGVQALGAALAQHFRIRVEFVDIDNPV